MQDIEKETDNPDLINIKTFCFSTFTIKNAKARIQSTWKTPDETHCASSFGGCWLTYFVVNLTQAMAIWEEEISTGKYLHWTGL